MGLIKTADTIAKLACFPALLALLISASSAQEAAAPNFRWKPVVDPNARITIRGITYAPEFALHDWNVQRAADAATDVTRFEVRSGDQWSEDRSSGENKERSELDGYKRTFAHGTDVWGAYSLFIEPGMEYRSDWTAISQMHGSALRDFHIHFKEGKLIVYSEYAGPGAAAGPSVRYTGPLTRNVWHDVVFHLREGGPPDGHLDLWLDKQKIINFAGPIGAVGNQAYWKFGIYRGYGPIATPFSVAFANMEIGTSDLTARIGNPLEIK